MDTLPEEVLAKVLWRLPPSDRLDSALTCHRWARAVSMSPLLEDVLVTIHGAQMDIARAVLIKSHRQYQNLRLSRVDLSDFDPEFWGNVGKNIRELELHGCRYTSDVFYKILRTCPRLECLKISSLYAPEQTVPMSDLSLPEDTNLEMIQASLSNVRRLHLGTCVTPEMLAHLLRVMLNVTSISLTVSRCTSYFVSEISDLLGTTRPITSLNFQRASGNEGKISLLKLCSPNLRELKLEATDFNWLTPSTYEAVSDCTELRRLTLPANRWFQDVHLKKLLLNNPHLETLDLSTDHPFSDEDLAPLGGLRKLRELSLRFLKPYFTNEFLRSLGKISTLQCLNLDGQINDVRVFHSLANLPNLHTFRVKSLNSECLNVILESVKNLSVLDIKDCRDLTDEDFAKLTHLTKLKRLKLKKGVKFTDRALEKGLGPPSLESLVLDSIPLTDAGLASIAAHHHHLRTFNLISCYKVTSRGIVNSLRSEPLLRELELHVDDDDEDEVLGELEELCPRLRVLRILSINRISAVERLEARRPMIRVITFKRIIEQMILG